MLEVAINGKFLADRMLGIARYAYELVRALDEVIDEDDHVELVVPNSVPEAAIPTLTRINVVRWGRLKGMAWEQVCFAGYLCLHRNLTALNLCNVAPVASRAGVSTIHDIMYKTHPEYYTTLRNKLSRTWHCLQYALIARRELAILTVSDYSKDEIERVYPLARGNVVVVPSSWEHVRNVEPATDWQVRYPDLVPGEFFFSLATLSRNKNGRWIFEVAKRNPELTFAMAGARYEADELACPPNVHLLGFVSEADAYALMANCRAFVYPSLCEGFGLPPIEALALGAEVIASNVTSLPEVLGDAVHYIDPLSYDVDLLALLDEPVGPREKTLEKYSYDKSATILMDTFDVLGSESA